MISIYRVVLLVMIGIAILGIIHSLTRVKGISKLGTIIFLLIFLIIVWYMYRTIPFF